MFERVRRFDRDRHHHGEGSVAVAERERTGTGDDRGLLDRDSERGVGRDTMREARLRQRDEFGGFNLGAAFFGWLVAIGLGALLTALLSAAGTAIGLTELEGGEASNAAEEIGIAGGILLLIVAMIAYYAGGYVAGRMSRFDGGRQGLGVWLFGLVVTILIGLAGAIFGSEYNVLQELDLPRIPVDEGDLRLVGLITLAVILVGALLAAIVGGKVGERFHRKVDRVI